MSDLKVIKFEPHGPAGEGMIQWEDIPESELASGTPVQRGHEYLNLDDGRLTAGVWDCTPFETRLEPYSVNEFMYLLEGSVSIVDESGHTETFVAGEGFIIPKGLPCIWRQTEYVRKYYVIFDDPSGHQPENPSALSAIRADLSAALPEVTEHDPSQYLSDIPDMSLLTLYSDLTSQFVAGIWDCSPMQRVPATLARSELMHILEGSGSITNADGEVFRFSAGDTFLVPIGMGYQWKNDEYVKKIFCSFTPE